MYVTYTPEDGDKREWSFRPGRVRVSEQVLIEKKSGMRWDEWVSNCKMGNASARRVLLWHLLRLEHPHYRFEDVPDFYADELLVELSVPELLEAREMFVKSGAADREDGRQMLDMMDAEIEESRAKYGDGESGKANSATSPSDTSGS